MIKLVSFLLLLLVVSAISGSIESTPYRFPTAAELLCRYGDGLQQSLSCDYVAGKLSQSEYKVFMRGILNG